MPRYSLRGGKWANPFKIGRDGTRQEAIAKYGRHLYDGGLINAPRRAARPRSRVLVRPAARPRQHTAVAGEWPRAWLPNGSPVRFLLKPNMGIK
jgi:hypothetical protein